MGNKTLGLVFGNRFLNVQKVTLKGTLLCSSIWSLLRQHFQFPTNRRPAMLSTNNVLIYFYIGPIRLTTKFSYVLKTDYKAKKYSSPKNSNYI